MIPRERSLVVIRPKTHHWVPVSEQGRFRLSPSFRRTLRLLLPAFAQLLGAPKHVVEYLMYESVSELHTMPPPWPTWPRDEDTP